MTDVIEKNLYRRRQELYDEVSIAFYDRTSLHLESAGGETLGQLGHSKDYRQHLKQVMLDMVLDGDDRRSAAIQRPGITADVTRLMAMVERCASARHSQICAVAGGGMKSADNMRRWRRRSWRTCWPGSSAKHGDPHRGHRGRRWWRAAGHPRQLWEPQRANKATAIKGRRYVLWRIEEEARKDA